MLLIWLDIAKGSPKFNEVDILFMGDYTEFNPETVVKQALEPGYDVVLIDSLAEVADMVC